MSIRQKQPPWVDGTPIPGVLFPYNAHIDIVSGPYAGQHGWLVGVDSRGTEPIYTVEIYEGEPNAEIPQSFLRARPNEEL
jgi:hypothetical protein